jgi:hypothetical protein
MDDIAAMRVILQHGAEVNQSGPLEKPFHEATQRGLDTVELLVEHDSDVEERNSLLVAENMVSCMQTPRPS